MSNAVGATSTEASEVPLKASNVVHISTRQYGDDYSHERAVFCDQRMVQLSHRMYLYAKVLLAIIAICSQWWS